MRVTNNTIVRGYINNLNNNLEQMARLQDQQSSGQKLRRPSDDPFNVARVIDINDTIERNEQYAQNIKDGTEWIKTTDDALSKIGDFIGRIYKLTNAASTGTNSSTELYAYKTEIMEDINGIIDIANTNYNGSYIFSGYMTSDKPLSLNTSPTSDNIFNKVGDNNMILREISPGVAVSINSTADQFLGNDNSLSEPLGVTFKSLIDNLSDPSKQNNLTNFLDRLTAASDNISRIRAQVGARQVRMESASANNTSQNDSITETLSKIADINIAEQNMKVNVASAVYQQSLMAGAKILQPSLLDFLR